MATVGTSTSSSTLSSLSAKTGIGGLVSGMDIDELVKSLTETSRQKILKQQQNVQKLEWKQTAYRSATSSLKGFQSKYLDVLSPTNFRSSSFFKTVTATSSSDRVTVSATSSASAGSITINSVSELATYQSVKSAVPASKALTGKMESTVAGTMDSTDIDSLIAKIADKSISLNLDGKVKTITFDSTFVNSVTADKTTAGLQNAFQAAIDTAFGVKEAANRVITVGVNNDQLTLSAPGSTVTVNAVGDDTATLTSLGFTAGQSNKLSTLTSLENLTLATPLANEDIFHFNINSVAFRFSKTDSLSSIINNINSSEAGVTISYSSITDKFMMVAKESGAGDNIMISDTAGNLMAAFGLTDAAGAEVTDGVNAVLTVNGQTITRSSNTMEIDGVKVTISEKTTEPTIITMTGNAASLMDSVKSFVEDYNKMVDLVNGLVREDIESDYQPLSDEQKEEMTETQITSWEEKAKSGILRGDSILKSISSKLHSVITGLSVGATSLYTMGITSAGYGENGKLQIDETKLKEALETNGAGIKELFTSENGIGNQLNNIITGATKSTGVKGTRGTLVEVAGVASTLSDTENSIAQKIKRTTKSITTLQDRLTDEESRLWNRFSAMEAALQQLNSQSSILSQFSNNQ